MWIRTNRGIWVNSALVEAILVDWTATENGSMFGIYLKTTNKDYVYGVYKTMQDAQSVADLLVEDIRINAQLK